MSGSGKKVFVMMSGGVDSSVTAALLKECGFDVAGVHIKMWSDPEMPCNFKADRLDAMRVAAHLDIPFSTWDFTKEYKDVVVEYMIAEYAAGRTPNPDVMCNQEIKFGAFLREALKRGADYVATGHYVRLRQSLPATSSRQPAGSWKLEVARDRAKDQSYFLWTLGQEQLRHALFPIGELTKPEVRAMARKRGIPTAEKKDSQGICFIGKINLPEFLKRYIPSKRGEVLTTDGKKIGEHGGVTFYTIGQRHGLGAGGGGIPHYVAQKNKATNTLVVVRGPYDEALFANFLTLRKIHWIAGRPPTSGFPFACEARIRYRQPLQRCRIEARTQTRQTRANAEETSENPSARSLSRSATIRVVFEEPQRAITPGQSVVFYVGEEMLGGGVIL